MITSMISEYQIAPMAGGSEVSSGGGISDEPSSGRWSRAGVLRSGPAGARSVHRTPYYAIRNAELFQHNNVYITQTATLNISYQIHFKKHKYQQLTTDFVLFDVHSKHLSLPNNFYYRRLTEECHDQTVSCGGRGCLPAVYTDYTQLSYDYRRSSNQKRSCKLLRNDAGYNKNYYNMLCGAF